MVRFGVMGAGKIASTFAISASGVGEHLYAIAARDLQRAEEFKKLHGFEVAYGSYEVMLSDPLVDCVYIATPHGLHYEHMLLALEHKKHILCEKAFTLNQKQALDVFEKAKKHKLFVMEALWTRFLPVIQEVKRSIERGDIGEIIQIDAAFCFNANLSDESRLAKKDLGGGALLDVGIYPITIANLFLGTPVAIESEVEFHHTGVDLSNKITYLYPSAEANLISSLGYEEPRDAFIYGTKGYIQIPHFNGAQQATIFDRNHKIIREIDHKHLVNGLEYEIFETVRCIKKKLLESPIMPHVTTLEILRQMDEIRAQWNLIYPQEIKTK